MQLTFQSARKIVNGLSWIDLDSHVNKFGFIRGIIPVQWIPEEQGISEIYRRLISIKLELISFE